MTVARTILLALTLAALVGCAAAPETVSESRTSTRVETSRAVETIGSPVQKRCTAMSVTAGKVMRGRQRGVAMSQYLQAFEKMEIDLRARRVPRDTAEATADLYKRMVRDAYKTRRFYSDGYKKRAAEDFENTWMRECMKALHR